MTPEILERITRGYLECVAWADAPEGTNPRFPATSRERGAADVAAFVKACGPLVQQALDCTGYTPERFGHDFWLTRCGHGAGYWDRNELEASACAVVVCLDRDGKRYYSSEGATELGAALSAIAYGTTNRISPFAYPSVYAYRGWLYFDGKAAA